MALHFGDATINLIPSSTSRIDWSIKNWDANLVLHGFFNLTCVWMCIGFRMIMPIHIVYHLLASSRIFFTQSTSQWICSRSSWFHGRHNESYIYTRKPTNNHFTSKTIIWSTICYDLHNLFWIRLLNNRYRNILIDYLSSFQLTSQWV